jgi:N-acetylmuramoyl-L-alanine amidase
MLQQLSPNFNDRPEAKIINAIIIHYTEISALETFTKFLDKDSKVSSHFVIDKNGEVTQMVEVAKRAWHAGISSWKEYDNLNDSSIGIEIANNGDSDFEAAQYSALILLIQQLKLKIPSIEDALILGHSDIAPLRKQDPGEKFDWELLHENDIGRYHELSLPDNNKGLCRSGDEGKKVKEMQNLLANLGYEIFADGKFGKKTAKIIYAFKCHFARELINDVWDEYCENIIKELL